MRTPPQAPFDSQGYWMTRHERFAGSHQATGLIGSTERANAVLYALRRRALLASLRTPHLAGAKVLDAGCGLGDFSRFYHERGAEVYGCDLSPVAVEQCRRMGAGTFECGAITDTPRLFPGVRFDIIHCFDVLYHLVDDGEWQASLQALDAVSAPRAEWYLTEIGCARGSSLHISVWGAAGYNEALARYRRKIAAERRLHWLLSVEPRVHARFPHLSLWLEPLCHWRPTRHFACGVLWTIREADAAAGAGESTR